jgi:hypothetical protein
VKYGGEKAEGGKKPNPLMAAAFGKAKGAPSEEEKAPDADDEKDDALSVSKSQIAAAKAIRSAATDEDYAKAMLAFHKLCKGY